MALRVVHWQVKWFCVTRETVLYNLTLVKYNISVHDPDTSVTAVPEATPIQVKWSCMVWSWYKLVSKWVGALSPVNRKGLHQGWTQTSLCLRVRYFTIHHTTSHVFWGGAFSLFIFCRHSTWEPASGRVTYFILQAYTGTNPTNPGEIGRGFVKTAGEWTGRVEISKEKNPGSKCSMYGCILTYSRL